MGGWHDLFSLCNADLRAVALPWTGIAADLLTTSSIGYDDFGTKSSRTPLKANRYRSNLQF